MRILTTPCQKKDRREKHRPVLSSNVSINTLKQSNDQIGQRYFYYFTFQALDPDRKLYPAREARKKTSWPCLQMAGYIISLSSTKRHNGNHETQQVRKRFRLPRPARNPVADELTNDMLYCIVTRHPGARATRMRASDKVANIRRQPSSELQRGREARDQGASLGIERKDCISQFPGKQRGSQKKRTSPKVQEVIESK